MSDSDKTEGFKRWAILELMGHRHLAGLVTQVEVAGAPMLRIDVPADGGEAGSEALKLTQWYSPGAVYCITPVSEDVARIKAAKVNVAPVHTWELPKPDGARPGQVVSVDDDDDDDPNDYQSEF